METIKNLMELKEAIYFTDNEGKNIWSGKSISITKKSSFKDYLNKPLYLVEGDLCYGVISLKNEKQTDDQFSYDLEFHKKFDNPVKIKFTYQGSDSIAGIEFLSDTGATAQTDVKGTGFTANPLAPFTITGKKRKRKYKIDDFEFELEDDVKELSVVKRGDRWCVVHGHPPKGPRDKPIGAVIKCFPTKEQAIAMHRAIIISEIRRKKMDETEPIELL